MDKRLGSYVITSMVGESVRAYIPAPLPPIPSLAIDRFYQQLDLANQAVGRLDGLQALLPNVQILLNFYNRREAVLSSQIEGTLSSLSELLLFESELLQGGTDAEEVSNYVAAMEHGLRRLREGFPLSNRLLREMHAILLRSGRGSDKTPGEFRISQNWIGGTRPGNAVYVPPPADELHQVMSDLERFLHREQNRLPLLIDAALVHVQFESAHPFLDGNGRIGRLLITLLLCERGVLQTPSLFLSLYLKENRDRYYELLQGVRLQGDWESWIDFFLAGVRLTAEQGCTTAVAIRGLFATDREKISRLPRNGTLLQIFALLEQYPFLTIKQVSNRTRMLPASAGLAMKKLEQLAIVRELTGRKRDRVFVYTQYMQLLEHGTGSLPSDVRFA